MPLDHYRRLLTSFAFLTAFAPLSSQARENAIVIGQAIDLSSANGSVGRDYAAGIKTYFDSLNAAGGINGRRIEYIVRDDRGQPEVAAKEVSELIERDHAEIIVGGIGDAVTQAVIDTPAFKRNGMTLFAPLASRVNRNDARVVFWRPGYHQEIQYLLSYFGKLGIKNVGILYQESSLYRSAYEGLVAEINKRGMKITETARIRNVGSDLEAETKRLAASKPGFVVTIGDTITTGLFLKTFRTYSAQTIVAGDSLINLSTLRELAGANAVEWTVFTQVVPNPLASQSLLQMEHLKMMKKYRDEDVSSLTLEGFAVAKALASAIRQAKQGNRFALRDLIAQKRTIDLGGLLIGATADSNHLSSYLDVALFRKGTALVF
jgi:ABC-type branched-subunit amino acid transport system substrate-binding protein